MSVFLPAIEARTCFRRSWREPWRGCWSRGSRSRPAFFGSFSGRPMSQAYAARALSARTAAVVGVILNLAVCFGIHVIFRETVPLQGYRLSIGLPVLPSIDL